MIKTPVSYDENELIYYPQIHDADGDYLFEAMDTDTAKEIVKRINMHDELVASENSLLPSLIRESFTESDGKKVMYFYELLERCK